MMSTTCTPPASDRPLVGFDGLDPSVVADAKDEFLTQAVNPTHHSLQLSDKLSRSSS